MWIFLATEVLLFSALFTSYFVYRFGYTEAFTHASSEMEYVLGAVNTAVLICSSFTMALAVGAAEQNQTFRSAMLLGATMLIGVLFLVIKPTEYYLHYKGHKVPGILFSATGPGAGPEQMFLIFYFIMTGLHAIHMLIGLGAVFFLLARMLGGTVDAEYTTPVTITGLYWHFIDIVWIFLFVVFYIPGGHVR
jgi:cytochrome c oxidase subunit 3